MGIDHVARLGTLARRQAGCISLSQAAAVGVGHVALRHLESSGVLERLHPGVLHFLNTEITQLTRTWAAVLAVGPVSVASHEAALCAGGVERVPYKPAVIVGPAHSHRHEGIRVHRFADLLPEHVTHPGGLPVTTIARAVVDVTSVFTRVRLEDLLDRLTITNRTTTIGAISRVYRQINRRGRFRIRVLGEVLDARAEAGPPPRSLLESQADEIIARCGLPGPIMEHPLPSGSGPPAGFVDRAWPDVRLLMEIDGRRWHARERTMARDRARDRQAAAAGWVTIRVLDEEIRDQPELVMSDLVAIHGARSAQLGLPHGPNSDLERL